MKRMILFTVLLTLFFLPATIGACLSPSDNLTVIQGPNNLKIKAAVIVPQGEGPFPAIIMAHGRLGFSGPFPLSSYTKVAKSFAADGFLVVVVEYDASDNSVLAGKSQKQIQNAIDVVMAQPLVKKDKIGLWGMSNGAATVLRTAAENDSLFAVAAIVPPTQRAIGTDKKIRVPLLLIGGDYDTGCPVSTIKQFEKSMLAQGRTVESFYGPYGHSHEYYAMTKRTIGFFQKYAAQ